MSEVKNTLNGISRKLDTSGEKINEPENIMETVQFGIQKENKDKKKKNPDCETI